MGNQRALDLCGAETVAGDIEDIVDAASDPVVAVFVATAAVTSEVEALVPGEVGLAEASVITPDGAGDSRPGCLDAEVAADIVAVEDLAVLVSDHLLYAEER